MRRESRVALIVLSAQARAVERAIESGTQAEALRRLLEAEATLGRRPEYRYLRHLFDFVFGIRTPLAILPELLDLVGEQPDLHEATALLADVYECSGDPERADLFAHLALESESASARARACAVIERANRAQTGLRLDSTRVSGFPWDDSALSGFGSDSRISCFPSDDSSGSAAPRDVTLSDVPPEDSRVASSRPHNSPPPDSASDGARIFDSQPDNTRISGLIEPDPREDERIVVRHSQRVRASPPAVDINAPIEAWFDYAKQQLVQRRTTTHGVRSLRSTAEILLDSAFALAVRPSVFSASSLPLSRAGLEQIDQTILEQLKGRGVASSTRADELDVQAIAGFLLAVVLHELQGTAVETSPGDGGCKAVVPSRASASPLSVTTAFIEGTGPGLAQTYDRLAASLELVTPSVHPPPPSRTRIGQPFELHVTRADSVAGVTDSVDRVPHASRSRLPARPSSRSMLVTSVGHPELACSRPQVEAQPLRQLESIFRSGGPPHIDLEGLARAFADSAPGVELAAQTGHRVTPSPLNIEALESYLCATRGRAGSAPDAATWQPSDRDESLILACGALLGETIIATYGGIWECDPNAPDDPRLFRVICHGRVGVWPITQAYLRLKCGAAQDLAKFLARVGQALGRAE